MAKFYGDLKGARGGVTRCGTAGSGISAHIRGRDQGIRIHVGLDIDGKTVAWIDVTGGSNNKRSVSSIRLSESDMDALRNGEVRLELVPVIADHYESELDPLDMADHVHYYERSGDTHHLDPLATAKINGNR